MPGGEDSGRSERAGKAPTSARTHFSTPTAKRMFLYRQRLAKKKKARAAAAAGGGCQPADLLPAGQKSALRASSSAPGQAPCNGALSDSEDSYSSDLSDSGEAQQLRTLRAERAASGQLAGPDQQAAPGGYYYPCDGQHPKGNPRRELVPKPALGCELAANGGRRCFTAHEKALVLGELDRFKDRERPDYAWAARRLRIAHRAYFGPGTPCMPEGISRQEVRAIHLQGCLAGDGSVSQSGQGRHPALPESVVTAVLALLLSVVKSKVINFSVAMLQPLAVGVIISKGFGATLASERKMGRFCAGRKWLSSILRGAKWKNVAPSANSRKLPPDWEQLCNECMLRLAYFVLLYSIPMALVVNAGLFVHARVCLRLSASVCVWPAAHLCLPCADHTGVMFLQYKGKGWLPEEMWKMGQKVCAPRPPVYIYIYEHACIYDID